MNLKLTITAGLTAVALFTSAGSALAAPGVTLGAVNMREGPGTGYDVIYALKKGKFVDIEACGGGWCEIEVNGDEGYVSASYLALIDDEDDYDDDYDDYGHHDVGVEVCIGGGGFGGGGFGYGSFCVEN
jgi:uncharacterized protein YraI